MKGLKPIATYYLTGSQEQQNINNLLGVAMQDGEQFVHVFILVKLQLITFKFRLQQNNYVKWHEFLLTAT